MRFSTPSGKTKGMFFLTNPAARAGGEGQFF
jgi:hypothetical protein